MLLYGKLGKLDCIYENYDTVKNKNMFVVYLFELFKGDTVIVL